MKKLFILFLFFVFASFSFAADSKNATTSYMSEDEQYIVYYGTIQFTAGATDNHYSKAFSIGNCSTKDKEAVIQVWCDGVGAVDINVFIQGSNSLLDSTFATNRTDTVFDDVNSATPVYSYVGWAYVAGSTTVPVVDAVGSCQYIRVMGDGQTSSPATSVLSYRIKLPKKTGAKKHRAGAVLSTTSP